MTALENVAVPLELAGVADAADRAISILGAVGLGHRLTHLPGQLSGGEQQRVALARAFVSEPLLLLADEPTGNLDQATGEAVIDLLFGLRERAGTTLLLITHDPSLAERCGRRVRLADGRVLDDGVAPGHPGRVLRVILALRLAGRELRTGVRGLRIVLACLALGVGVIAGVGSLREAVDRGLAADGRQLLGGDLEIESGAQALPETVRAWLAARGGRLSEIVFMRSMLVAPSGERQLIELKAVDPAWPLVGEPGLEPSQPVSDALGLRGGRYGLVAQRVVLDRLGLKQGGEVRLGNATLTVRGVLAVEPDRVAGAAALAPRAIISAAVLPSTGLIAPGSIVEHAMRVALPPGSDAVAVAADLRTAFPDQGWRIRNSRNAAPGVTRFIDRTGLFMTLVGLTALLVGGIGAANGVRAWLEARAGTIATLRCLGASARLVLAVYLLQVMALTLGGIVIGLAAGAVLPPIAGYLLRDLLPVAPQFGLFAGPLALAAGFGLLTAGAFVLWPLGRAARIPGAALFRQSVLPDRVWPEPWLIAANAVRRIAPGRFDRAGIARSGFRRFGSAPPHWAPWPCSAPEAPG